MLRALILGGAAVLAVPALVVAWFWLGQRRLIYYPLDQPVPPAPMVLRGATDVELVTSDGLRLGGWFIAPAAPSSAAVLVFNGNAGDRSGRAPLAQALSRAGLAVLLFDYRGYGGNPGRPTEEGLLQDARAAISYLEARPDVRSGHLVYFGESLGAAVAVAAAAEREPAALILRSPFTNLADVGRFHYPYLPVGWMLADRYPSIDQITRLSCPLLVLAGERDRVVPQEQSRRLFEASSARAKRFVSIATADHDTPALVAGEEMVRHVLAFLSAETDLVP